MKKETQVKKAAVTAKKSLPSNKAIKAKSATKAAAPKRVSKPKPAPVVETAPAVPAPTYQEVVSAPLERRSPKAIKAEKMAANVLSRMSVLTEPYDMQRRANRIFSKRGREQAERESAAKEARFAREQSVRRNQSAAPSVAA